MKARTQASSLKAPMGSLLIFMALGMVLVGGPARAAASGLTPGVSTPDAFMAEEPPPPISGQEAVRLQARVAEYAKLLDREGDILGRRSDKSAEAGLPGQITGANGQPPSFAQEMALARRLNANGGAAQLAMLGRHQSEGPNQTNVALWSKRVQAANQAIFSADGWLETAKDGAASKRDKSLAQCPMHQLGELTERDPTCVRSARLAYQQGVQHLAVTYLQKVNGTMNNLFAITKILVDQEESFARKLDKPGSDQLVEGQVYTLQQTAVSYISKYNELLGQIVNQAAELAKFKVDLSY